jgi:nucleoside-diphosphate-sugar epimerase
MDSTILVTGGTGFLGKRLGLALKDKHNVVLTGRNNKQNMLAQGMTDCRVLPMDVTNIESVRDVLRKSRPTS